LLYSIRVIRFIRRRRKREIYLHENFHIWKSSLEEEEKEEYIYMKISIFGRKGKIHY